MGDVHAVLYVYMHVVRATGAGQVMCVQYWPVLNEKEEVFGDITVAVTKEEQLANFVIRTVHLRKDGEV